jgi:hypothetical protein
MMLLQIESELVIGISFLLVPVVSFLLLCKRRLDCRIDQIGNIIITNFVRSYHLKPVNVDHIAERAFLLGCGDVCIPCWYQPMEEGRLYWPFIIERRRFISLPKLCAF